MKYLIFMLAFAGYTKADLQNDAGCHSDLYFADHDVSTASYSTQSSVISPDNSSVTFISKVSTSNPSTGPCSGPYPHLFAIVCPHNSLTDANKCKLVDTCSLVTSFPAKKSMAEEYIVHSSVVSDNYYFVLTTDTLQSIVRIYRCDTALIKCIVADIPFKINIAQPFIKASLSSDVKQLHVTYDTWATNAETLNVYTMLVTCTVNLSGFKIYNISDITGAPITQASARPSPIVARKYLHIATFESIRDTDTMVIYSCDWKTIACVRREISRDNLPSGIFLPGHTLVHWPLNDYLYLSYYPNAGYYGFSGMNRCALAANGDIQGDCNDSQFTSLDQSVIPAGTPAISFANYLGGVVVAFQNLNPKSLVFVQYDADFLGNPKHYQYDNKEFGVPGTYEITSPSIFDIDSSTVLMRAAYMYANYSDASYHVHVGDVDVFPSKADPESILFFSPGYNKFYPPPLRQECIGTTVDVVASCPAILQNGTCKQAWIFSGGDLIKSYIEYQPCFPKSGYGLSSVYPRATNPNSQFACVNLDNSKPSLTYFDDGPSIPLAVDLIFDALLGQIPSPPGPSTALSSIVNSALPIAETADSLFSTLTSAVDSVNPGSLFSATSARIAFWPGGKAHDLCYHNTVRYAGYDKAMCDAMVYKRWAAACVTNYVGIIYGIISDIAKDKFPGESILECETLAFIYYFVLRTSSAAQQAYLASNSEVIGPSFDDIPDGFVFSGNSAPDPSLIRQNGDLINSTIYTDQNGALKANFTRYLQLLQSSPLVSTSIKAMPPPQVSAPKPTIKPTLTPTLKPTSKPATLKPPTLKPTLKQKPAKKPTTKLTKGPASKPTRKPTKKPTRKPTKKPTRKPTKKPTNKPKAR